MVLTEEEQGLLRSDAKFTEEQIRTLSLIWDSTYEGIIEFREKIRNNFIKKGIVPTDEELNDIFFSTENFRFYLFSENSNNSSKQDREKRRIQREIDERRKQKQMEQDLINKQRQIDLERLEKQESDDDDIIYRDDPKNDFQPLRITKAESRLKNYLKRKEKKLKRGAIIGNNDPRERELRGNLERIRNEVNRHAEDMRRRSQLENEERRILSERLERRAEELRQQAKAEEEGKKRAKAEAWNKYGYFERDRNCEGKSSCTISGGKKWKTRKTRNKRKQTKRKKRRIL